MNVLNHIFVIITLLFSLSTAPKHNYPIPEKTNERLFFIQRNLNANTIVYDANFDSEGNLKVNDPIDVYWIRYDEQGQRMELRKIERTLAFGIEFSKLESNENHYLIHIVAEKNRDIILKQTAPFEAKAFLKIDNKMSQLCYLYLQAEDGIIPELKAIEYHGIDTVTKKSTYEKVLY